MAEWTVRVAETGDAEDFANWVKSNNLIDPDDVLRTIKGNNPTCVHFVACLDGKPVAFAPVYAQTALAHLAFSPDARGTDKLRAMNVLLDFVTAFSHQLGIREITTRTKPEYPVAKWALAHGFEEDSREVLTYDINKQILEKAEVVPG